MPNAYTSIQRSATLDARDRLRHTRQWEDLVGEAMLDHATAESSIAVLACYEYLENGPSL